MVLTLLMSAALTASLATEATQGEVKLPLRDYLDLVQRAEEADRARAAAAASAEPPVAELTSQRTTIVWNDDAAELTTLYDVQIQGAPATGVLLPVTGLAFAAEIRPRASASLNSVDTGLSFVTTDPGHYQVEVRSRATIETTSGVSRLRLSPFTAPVGEFEVSLSENLGFRCPGAVIAEDAVREHRRRVRFALPRGQGATIETRRADLVGSEADELLASAVVVTIVDLRTDGPLRHDVVLYEVARGRMDAHEITLPAGLEVERLATDEGPSPPLNVDGVLRVDRKTRLEKTGYLALTSRPRSGEDVLLSPIVPRTPVRARYLAFASSVAAEVRPLPEPAWLRVDLEDLPTETRTAATGVDFVSAWRLDDEGASVSSSLHVNLRPPATLLPTVVTERESLTLLTTEGTLVVRDQLSVETRETAFRVRLPDGATLWSVRVDDRLVRPVERNGEILIPLSFGGAQSPGATESVEIIAVREQALPEKRARLSFELPEIGAPVLAHRWQVMLPEGNRYRYAGGDLTPAIAGANRNAQPPPVAPNVGRLAVEGSSRALGMGGSGELWGQVVDSTALPLPGATVTLTNQFTGWSATVVADRNGGFWFQALPIGTYTLNTAMSGFSSRVYEGLRVSSGRTYGYSVRLDVAAVTETVTVAAEAPRISALELKTEEEPETSAEFRDEALRLRNGLVGGVKPLAIVIPESGKLLTLTGALPPAVVRVEIEVRPR